MGKKSYFGGSTVVGPKSGWFSFNNDEDSDLDKLKQEIEDQEIKRGKLTSEANQELMDEIRNLGILTGNSQLKLVIKPRKVKPL